MPKNPMFQIVVTKMNVTAPRCAGRLRQAVEVALRRHKTASAKISVTLVDDACIARLNARYRGHKGPTDVLSFDLRDEFREPVPNKKRMPPKPAAGAGAGQIEGEIVISVDAAHREAEKRGHHVVSELTLYALHGTLHLLGYNDRRKGEAERMHQVEDEILTAVGLGAVFRTPVR